MSPEFGRSVVSGAANDLKFPANFRPMAALDEREVAVLTREVIPVCSDECCSVDSSTSPTLPDGIEVSRLCGGERIQVPGG